MVWAGFAAILFASAMSWVVLCAPARPEVAGIRRRSQTVFGNAPRIVMASIAGFLRRRVRQLVRPWPRSRSGPPGPLALAPDDRLDDRRRGGDSLIFYPVAFLGIWDERTGCSRSWLTNYCLKVGWEVLATPLTYQVVGFLKRGGRDTNTDYALLAENDGWRPTSRPFSPEDLKGEESAGSRRSRPMCGIVGYTGPHEASPILLAGLRRLEYRGYDSAGVATLDGDRTVPTRSKAGRVRALEEACSRASRRRVPAGSATPAGPRTAGHRHATPTPTSAAKGPGTVAVVHNGVIENHGALRHGLEAAGVGFRSQTDTEVIAHLIAEANSATGTTCSPPSSASCPRLEGTYGLAVVSPSCPGQVVGRQAGQPPGRRAGRGSISSPATRLGHRTRTLRGWPISRTARSSA